MLYIPILYAIFSSPWDLFFTFCAFSKNNVNLCFLITELLTLLRGFKFVTLVLVLEKVESKDKTEYDNFYSSSKAETITNESDVDNW